MATIVTIDGPPQLGFADGPKKQKGSSNKTPIPGRPNCYCFENKKTGRRGWYCHVKKDPTKVATGKNRTGVSFMKGLCPIPPK